MAFRGSSRCPPTSHSGRRRPTRWCAIAASRHASTLADQADEFVIGPLGIVLGEEGGKGSRDSFASRCPGRRGARPESQAPSPAVAPLTPYDGSP
jgi:hypothetical protein